MNEDFKDWRENKIKEIKENIRYLEKRLNDEKLQLRIYEVV